MWDVFFSVTFIIWAGFFFKNNLLYFTQHTKTVQNFLIHSEYFNRFRLIKLFCQSNALSLTVNGKNIFGNVTNPLKWGIVFLHCCTVTHKSENLLPAQSLLGSLWSLLAASSNNTWSKQRELVNKVILGHSLGQLLFVCFVLYKLG